MAKKKQKKEKEKFEYSEEILGVLIVLICVIGILGYGRAGNFFRSFAVFLTGICYAPFLIILLILGLYLIVKRKMPNLLTTKFIGSYMISLTLLVYCHREYIKLNSGSKIITETFTNVMSSFRSPQVISNTGGGMIGAIFGYTFDWAFSDGIYIVLITIALLGLILVFNTSLIDLVKKIKVLKFKKVKKDIKESNEEERKYVYCSIRKSR